MRSIGMFNAVSVMVGSGEQLVRAMGVIKDFFFWEETFITQVIKDVFLAPMQTAIDALEQKIRDIQNRIEDLTEEERRLVPRALKRLFEVQRNLVLTRESLVSLAGTTIRRVNSLIRAISKIGPRTKKVGLKVKLMLRKFDSLLQNSRKVLSTAKEDYIGMSTNLNEVRAHLMNFGDSVMKQAKRLEDQMNENESLRRVCAYGLCESRCGSSVLRHSSSHFGKHDRRVQGQHCSAEGNGGRRLVARPTTCRRNELQCEIHWRRIDPY